MIRTLRFCARNGMLNWRYGRLLLALPEAAPLHGRRAPLAQRRPALPRPRARTADRPQRAGRVRPLRLDRRRHQDPLPRGRRRDRREDRDRPGVHDLRLPAGADRRAVRDRRPGDVHRLRPRRRRGRALDPRAGHLQARRRGRLQRLDRLRRLHPARRQGRRQLDRRHQLGRHQGRAGERGRRRHPGPRDPDARGAAGAALGASRSSPTRPRGRPCRSQTRRLSTR